VVTVAGGIDREAAGSYNITVRATSSDTSTTTRTFTITIGDVDEFDVAAPADSNGSANAVNENATNGTTVGITASASDADATNNTVAYSLTDDAGGRFTINANSGVVTVANGSLLDREAAASYNITVRATSVDGSTATATFTINLNDVDEFDVTVPADNNGAPDAVDENAANGTPVGITAVAADADATTNTITYSLTDSAGGRFTINANSGVVTVANGGLINREAAAAHSITVRATSADGSTADTTFTITIGDVDEFDVTAPADSDGTANAVNENAADGTTVGITASASDADATTNTVTYSLTDDAGGRFTIDTNTGVVTVANGVLLDREAAASHNITVRATSADGSTATATFTINVNDVDEFEVSAVTDSNVAPNAVDENAAVGTTVGLTGLATDADATATITYSLDDDAGGRFAIHATTGVVTVNGALDYETATSHSVTIRATSSDGSQSTQTFTITVNDVGESSVGAISDTDVAADYVLENAANGTTVGLTAFADDPDAMDTVSYSLDDDAGGRFAIHATTGVVTVAGGINREAAGSYDITVRATSSDTSTSTRTFTITIGDVDEFDVTAPTDSNVTANAVNENAANGTVVGITASASDADATTNTVTYSLTDDAGGRFTINANSGIVTVANGSLLDRESAASHSITVRATSTDGSTADTTFTINVNDVDEFDVGAVVDSNAAANTVAENAAVGTAVGLTGLAIDADATATVSYSLDDNAGGRFAIDANTGVVTVNAALDYETATSHSVTIRATSSDGSFSTQNFTIAVTDVNESGITAISDTDGAADYVLENTDNGTTVGVTAFADDPDGTDTVSYSLDDNAGGRFAIHATTGVVTVSGGIDREAAGSYDITVRATSSDTSTTTRTFTITIGDVDEFDVTAPADSDGAANAVNENAANGTTVGITASASDADATTNTVTYSLTDDAGGRFTINANSGIVTVANGSLLDRESAASHNITVRATSADGSTADSTFTINVNDVDEFDVTVPVDVIAAANTVAENAGIGTVVGITASASDADATTNTITYALDDNAGGRFAIDVNTGVVTVAGVLDYETNTSHDITVRATSADGSFSTQTFSISVTDVNDQGPVATGDHYRVIQGEPLIVTIPGLLANDLDGDGDVLTAVLVTNVAFGSLALNADGSFTYVPAATFSGTDQFTYMVSDGNSSSAPVTVTIVVEAVAPDNDGGDGTDPDPPPEEEPDDHDLPPVEVPTLSGESDVPFIALCRDDRAEQRIVISAERSHGQEDSPVGDAGDDGMNSITPWRLEVACRPANTLRVAVPQASEGDDELAAERGSRYVSRFPLSMAPASSVDNPSDGAGTLTSEQLVLGTTAATATVLSVGYICWLIRGGSLFASLLASLPAWTSFDPLWVLSADATSDEEDEERLQDIVA